MWNVTLKIRSFVLFTVVMIGIITRLMIGYSAFANPLHRHSGASLQAATSEMIQCDDNRFHSFKIRRKIALETATHFPLRLELAPVQFAFTHFGHFEVRDDHFSDPIPSQRLRPPTTA